MYPSHMIGLIRHITVTECPHCNAGIQREEVTGQHSNGQQFESRTFACGYTLRYVPNFGRAEIKSECTRCTAYREKVEKRKAANEAVKAFVQTLDVDEDYKAQLVRHIY